MCGIAGFFKSQKSNLNVDGSIIANQMADTLKHRGPDDKGVWTDDVLGIALAYQRLAIIDLSKNGSQPMTSQDNRWVIVYNGEIYNHIQLRKNLKECGFDVAWKGHSDTETLLACIQFWGIEKSLDKLTGMFAFSAIGLKST